MKFSDALEQSNPRNGAVCRTGEILAALDPADAADLVAALDPESSVYSSTIARALQKMGHRIGDGAVNRHRRGDCRCG